MLHRFAPLLLISLALLGASAPIHAEVQPTWVTTYFDGQSFNPQALAVDDDGYSYVISTIERTDDDIAVTKFDPAGDFVWQQVLSGVDSPDWAGDLVLDVEQTRLYVTFRGVPDDGYTALILYKLDAASGATIWDTFFRPEGTVTVEAEEIAATPDGGVALTGDIWLPDHRSDYLTLRYDADGNKLWHHTYDDGGQTFFNYDNATEIAIQADGDVVVSGTAQPIQGGSDIVTFCFDGLTGAVKWQARYSTGANEVAWDLAIAPDGDAVVLGTDPGGIDLRWVVARYDGDTGQEQWQRLVEPGFDEFPRSVAVDAAGDVYASGSTDPDGDDGNGNPNAVLFSLAGADGSVRWYTELGSDERFQGVGAPALKVLGGRVYAAGAASDDTFVLPGQAPTVALLLELDAANGALLDFSSIDTTTDPNNLINDRFHLLEVDAAGRLYAAGRTYDDPDPDDGRLELVQFTTSMLFTDDFESGDTGAWSTSQ